MTALRKMTLMPAQRLEKRARCSKIKDEFAWEGCGHYRIRRGSQSSTKQHMKNRCGIRRGFNCASEWSYRRQGWQLVDGIFPGRAARAHFTVSWLRPVLRSRAPDQKPQKTMMPTAGKCYIVLRTFAFTRKDSL